MVTLILLLLRNTNLISFLKEIFFCPKDMIGLLLSNLGIFQLQEFVVWVFIDLPGVVIWQHIHPSTLHSYWEEGWQDSNCLNHTAVLQLSHREIFIFLKIPGKDLTGSLWIISSLQNKAQNVVLQQEIYHLCVTLHQTSWFVWATWVYYTRIAGSFSLY